MNALIFQCPACRALVGATRAELQPGRAGLRCEACGAVAWLQESGSRVDAQVVDVEPPPRTAPARELPPTSGALVVAPPSAPSAPASQRPFGADVRDRVRVRLESLPPPLDSQLELAAGFELLLDSWHGDAAHKAMLKRASGCGELAFIGQRYRAVLDVVPDDPAARRAQQEILTLAVGALSATRDLGALGEDSAGKTRRRALVAAIILFSFIAIVQWALREGTALLHDDADGAKMTPEAPAEYQAR